jgi:hypothetical protein
LFVSSKKLVAGDSVLFLRYFYCSRSPETLAVLAAIADHGVDESNELNRGARFTNFFPRCCAGKGTAICG